MKQALLLIVFATSIFSASAQTGSAKQVKWDFSAKKLADKKYEVKMTATIAGTFHIYAVNAGVEGPVPTTITFTPNPLIALQGKISEQGKKITKVEEVWGGKVNFFDPAEPTPLNRTTQNFAQFITQSISPPLPNLVTIAPQGLSGR